MLRLHGLGLFQQRDEGVQEDHAVAHDAKALAHQLVVSAEVVHELQALLLAIDDDLVEVRRPDLLGFDYQVVCVTIREVDLHLEFIDLLAWRPVDLGYVGRVQTLDTLNQGI